MCVNLSVFVSQLLMWAGYIIKINDIVCPLPKHTHTHRLQQTRHGA